ncbi:MAG: hypothetical protein ACRDL7_10055, partial [Gaiellaceae bacterium]
MAKAISGSSEISAPPEKKSLGSSDVMTNRSSLALNQTASELGNKGTRCKNQAIILTSEENAWRSYNGVGGAVVT